MKFQLFYWYSLILFIANACVTVQPSTELDEPKEVQSVIDTNYTRIAQIDEQATFITTDKLLNVYLITRRGELVKFTPEGKELARYNNFSLGQPSLIDATNPFQVLAYYPEFMTVVTLDKTMNEAAKYELFDLELNNVDALCFSADGNVWLYDPTTFQLKKIDRNSATLQESNDFSQRFDQLPQPTFLLERNNALYLNDPKQGIFVFDAYGQYLNTIPVTGLKRFQVLDDQLVYYKNGALQAFHLKSLTTRPIALPSNVQRGDEISIEKNRLFIATDEGVSCYLF